MTDSLIHTCAWTTSLPRDHQRIGVSRNAPKSFKGRHWMVGALAPPPFDHTMGPREFEKLYRKQLQALDPDMVRRELFKIGPKPVLCGNVEPVHIHAGTKFCHRHLIAKWLRDTLGLTVSEIGHPDLYPFRVFDRLYYPLLPFEKTA